MHTVVSVILEAINRDGLEKTLEELNKVCTQRLPACRQPGEVAEGYKELLFSIKNVNDLLVSGKFKVYKAPPADPNMN